MVLIPAVPQPTQADGRITQTLHVLLACLRPVGWRPIWTGLRRFRVRADITELATKPNLESAIPSGVVLLGVAAQARVRAPLDQFGNRFSAAIRVEDPIASLCHGWLTVSQDAAARSPGATCPPFARRFVTLDGQIV